MAKEIDEEIRSIIETGFDRAESLLSENVDKLHLVAGVLLELETLDAAQFEALVSGEKTPDQLISDTKEQEKNTEAANAKEAAEHLAEMEAQDQAESIDGDEEDYEEDTDELDEDTVASEEDDESRKK
jgi:cell division protease FtsH